MLIKKVNLVPYSNIENNSLRNPDKLIKAQLNISSLVEILHTNIILLISETKTDSSFPTAQFERLY